MFTSSIHFDKIKSSVYINNKFDIAKQCTLNIVYDRQIFKENCTSETMQD